jgi:hypothetical protein
MTTGALLQALEEFDRVFGVSHFLTSVVVEPTVDILRSLLFISSGVLNTAKGVPFQLFDRKFSGNGKPFKGGRAGRARRFSGFASCGFERYSG